MSGIEVYLKILLITIFPYSESTVINIRESQYHPLVLRPLDTRGVIL